MTLQELYDHIGNNLKAGADGNMPVEVPSSVQTYAMISPLSAYITPNDDDPGVDRFVIVPAEWVETT